MHLRSLAKCTHMQVMLGPGGPSLGKTIRGSLISEFTRPAGIPDYLLIPVSFPSLIEGCWCAVEVQQLLKVQLPLVSECHVDIIMPKPWLVIMVSHGTRYIIGCDLPRWVIGRFRMCLSSVSMDWGSGMVHPSRKFYFSLELALAVGLGNNWSVGFIFMMCNRAVLMLFVELTALFCPVFPRSI